MIGAGLAAEPLEVIKLALADLAHPLRRNDISPNHIRAAYKVRSRDAMDKLIASHAIALEVPLVGDKQFYANSRSTTHAIDDRRRNGTDDQAVTALKALAREVLFEHLPHCSLASMDIGGHGRLG